jgi:hypothetical protein
MKSPCHFGRHCDVAAWQDAFFIFINNLPIMVYDEKASCHGSCRFGKTPRQMAAIGAQHHIGRRDATKAFFSATAVGVETPTYYRKAATRLM